MPEKKTALTFDALMSDLKAGHYAPIYLLMGDESYYIDQISNYIQKNVLKADQQAFDQTVAFGADVSATAIADLAMQFPMMSPYKVIIVKEAQALRSFDKLEKYALKPQPRTILVLCYKNGTIDRRLKFFTAVSRTGVVFESKKLREWQLPGLIQKHLQKQNVSIDEKSCAMIAENIGADLNRLMSELDKLVISLPENDRRVTPEIVEKNIGVSKDFNVFELRDAIVNRNVLKANRIIKYFDENKKAGSLFSYLPLLFSFFQNLMIAYYSPHKNDQQQLAADLELRNVWGVKDYMAGLRNYSGKKTLQILLKLRQIDAMSKGINNPSTPEGDLAKELIFFIMH